MGHDMRKQGAKSARAQDSGGADKRAGAGECRSAAAAGAPRPGDHAPAGGAVSDLWGSLQMWRGVPRQRLPWGLPRWLLPRGVPRRLLPRRFPHRPLWQRPAMRGRPRGAGRAGAAGAAADTAAEPVGQRHGIGGHVGLRPRPGRAVPTAAAAGAAGSPRHGARGGRHECWSGSWRPRGRSSSAAVAVAAAEGKIWVSLRPESYTSAWKIMDAAKC